MRAGNCGWYVVECERSEGLEGSVGQEVRHKEGITTAKHVAASPLVSTLGEAAGGQLWRTGVPTHLGRPQEERRHSEREISKTYLATFPPAASTSFCHMHSVSSSPSNSPPLSMRTLHDALNLLLIALVLITWHDKVPSLQKSAKVGDLAGRVCTVGLRKVGILDFCVLLSETLGSRRNTV